MNNKYRNFQVRKYVFPSICLGLILSALSCLCLYSFSLPKKENKLSFLVAASDIKKNDFINKLDSFGFEDIYEYEFTCYEADSNFFLTYFASSIGNVDITIVPSFVTELGIFKSNLSKYFTFDGEFIDELDLSSFSFYESEDKKIGLKIYDGCTKSGLLEDYIAYSDYSYYLFVSASSSHLNNNRKNIYSLLSGVINL